MGLSLYRRHFILGLAATALARVSAANPALATAPKPRNSKLATLLILGDSLSAEYGLKRGSGWVALLENKLQAENIQAAVVNASISGDTTSGGRSRLPALLLQHRPTHLIIELGANDALRGLPLESTRENLSQMVSTARAQGIAVLLLGMQVPPNYGQDYSKRFAAVFASVAKTHHVALMPFFLKNVADVPDSLRLFQPDRIHPREEAHPILLANVWPELKKILK
jgi:acyl-CoA thioesterase-1